MKKITNERVTLLDIASDAGVSRATVSLVIRNVPTVAEKTRSHVLASLQKLGYVYHRGAANLRRQQSHAIGLIISDITNPFFAQVIVAIEERLAAQELVALLGNTSEDAAKEKRLLRTMREFPADGILLCPAVSEPPETTLTDFNGSCPVVAFARRLAGHDYAGINNALGAELAIRHLRQIGHRRIAFLGGNPELSTGAERLKGYRQAFARTKLSLKPDFIVPSIPNRRGGYEGIRRLFKLNNPPSAALCFNDVVALGAMEALQHLGKKPGRDFGIVGFNNIPEAAQSEPALTTVDTTPRHLGETAAELLLKRIGNPTLPHQETILQPKLVVRESCGAGSGRTQPAAKRKT
jgi:LacI family transcriptional regulator